LKVKEVADLTGISVRTLHYYDEIGLLVPNEKGKAGYQFYSEKNLKKLQQILLFKEIDFSLNEIKKAITDPLFDYQATLVLQRKLLIQKIYKSKKILHAVDKTIKNIEGDIVLTNEERFAGLKT